MSRPAAPIAMTRVSAERPTSKVSLVRSLRWPRSFIGYDALLVAWREYNRVNGESSYQFMRLPDVLVCCYGSLFRVRGVRFMSVMTISLLNETMCRYCRMVPGSHDRPEVARRTMPSGRRQ